MVTGLEMTVYYRIHRQAAGSKMRPVGGMRMYQAGGHPAHGLKSTVTGTTSMHQVIW